MRKLGWLVQLLKDGNVWSYCGISKKNIVLIFLYRKLWHCVKTDEWLVTVSETFILYYIIELNSYHSILMKIKILRNVDCYFASL